MRRACLALAATSLVLALGAGPAQAHHPGEVSGCMATSWLTEELCPSKRLPALGNDGAARTSFGETDADELRLVSSTPKSELLRGSNSDIAFQGDFLFQGNYDGFAVYDISKPEPRLVSETVCPGSQNDISVFGDLVITSTDSVRNTGRCEGNTAGNALSLDGNNWEGLRIFDVSDKAAPKLLTTVRTKCGSHTHTLVPDEKNGKLFAYVSSYSPGANTNCLPPHRLISIVEIPLADPMAARVAAEPALLPLSPTTSGCHDITAYPAKGIAAGACMGEGMIFDISNPASPQKLATILDRNFSFWHSATFSDDGSKVIFTDELGGGSAARCTDAYGPDQGADAIYDITDRRQPKFLSYFKIPRFQTTQENCVSHNGSLLPHPTRDLFVQAWYQGGTSVIDFTDAANPKEVAFFDRGPIDESRLVLGGHWSSYWYNGLVYGNEIHRGLDVLDYTGDDKVKVELKRLNAQTQEPFPAK